MAGLTSYYGQTVDMRATPQRPDLVAKAIVPDYRPGAHTGSLGLTFNSGTLFAGKYRRSAFIGQHALWNRSPPSGYKVIFVPFAKGVPAGPPQHILTGFLNSDGDAMGRPLGVIMDAESGILVADDVGNKVWRVIPDNLAQHAANP